MFHQFVAILWIVVADVGNFDDNEKMLSRFTVKLPAYICLEFKTFIGLELGFNIPSPW
jgi:hypothetical protein